MIGSGPGGQKAALAAAELGRRVAVIDRPDRVGGVVAVTDPEGWEQLRGLAVTFRFGGTVAAVERHPRGPWPSWRAGRRSPPRR